MTGLKYKLAHKRAEKDKWSTTDNAQRGRLIQILQELIAQLKNEMIGAAKDKNSTDWQLIFYFLIVQLQSVPRLMTL